MIPLRLNTLRRIKSSTIDSTRAIAEQEDQHGIIGDTDEETVQREAAICEMNALRDWFDSVLSRCGTNSN